LADVMNRAFRERLVEAGSGGRQGGGARLSPFGREVLSRYRAMEIKAAKSVAGDIRSFRRLLADRD
jgi:molybdate transport system regulatory protein